MTFESLYLSRASNRLNEAISQAFASGSRGPPGQAEGINIARAIANELDSAKFDPLLIKATARYAATAIENLVNRADNLVGLSPVVYLLRDLQAHVSGFQGTCCRQPIRPCCYFSASSQRTAGYLLVALLVSA